MSKLFTADYWSSIWQHRAERVGEAALTIVAIILGYWIVRVVAFTLIGRVATSSLSRITGDLLLAREARVRALQSVLRSVAGFVLAFVAIVMVLQAVGISVVPLLTTASVAGLAIGFGAQKLVRDVISGFFILMEDQYGLGETVTIGAVTGVVEELSMRTTRVRDPSGKLWIISNGDVAQVCNHSRGTIRVTLDVPIAASADVDEAIEVLRQVAESFAVDARDRVLDPFVVEGPVQVSGASVTLRLVGGVAPYWQEKARYELNSRIRRALQEHGLQLA